MEIVVDAYDEEERAMGWYAYLEDVLKFPFKAECMEKRPISPLTKGSKVEVIGMASADECGGEMFVKIKYPKQTLAVPLSQLEGIGVDGKTKEAMEDWLYWVKMGNEF